MWYDICSLLAIDWHYIYIVAILPSTRNQEASCSAPGLCPFSLSWKLTDVPWKSLVGRCVPYWNCHPFLGDVCCSFQGVFDAHASGQCQPKNIENRNQRQVPILCACKYVIMLNLICIYNTYIYTIIYIIININVQQQQQQQQQQKSAHPLWPTRFESPHGRWDKT